MYGELSKILEILSIGYGCLHDDNSMILMISNMKSKSVIYSLIFIVSNKKKLAKTELKY